MITYLGGFGKIVQTIFQCTFDLQSRGEGCENQSQICPISRLLCRTFNPRLENNNTLKCSSDNFAWTLRYVVIMENCGNYTSMMYNKYVFNFQSIGPLVPFKRLFSPTSWIWKSNMFRDSQSLGENNSKSGLILDLKSPNNKKKVLGWFCLTKNGRNQASRLIRDLWLKGVLLILAYF